MDNIDKSNKMAVEQTFYASLLETKVSTEPIEGEDVLQVMIALEDIERMKCYMEKSKAGIELDKSEEQFKILFALFYELGSDETKKNIDEMME